MDHLKNEEFEWLLENYKNLIYKVANAYCQDSRDREDLVQEIVLQMWKSFPNYNPEFAYGTWVYRIALNVSISYYRKAKTRNKVVHHDTDQLIILNKSQSNPTDWQEEIRMLHHFINQLNALDKALILLYLDQTSQKDMAEILGISVTNVATKIGRIKAKLKEKFTLLTK